MKKIKLTKGQYAIVDNEDFEWLNQWIWHVDWSKYTKSYYAKRGVFNGKNMTSIRMHREILNAPKSTQTDHINHNTLDNRKINLRIVTARQNAFNRSGAQINNKSGFKGVFRRGKKWGAQIGLHGKYRWLGVFTTPEEAALVYNEAAKKLFGEYACLNKVHP